MISRSQAPSVGSGTFEGASAVPDGLPPLRDQQPPDRSTSGEPPSTIEPELAPVTRAIARHVDVPRPQHSTNLRTALALTGRHVSWLRDGMRSFFFYESGRRRTDMSMEEAVSRLTDLVVTRLWGALATIQTSLRLGDALRPLPGSRWFTSDLSDVEFVSPGMRNGMTLQQMLRRGTLISHLLGSAWQELERELPSPLPKQAMPWLPRTPIELLLGLEAEMRGDPQGPRHNRAAWLGEGQSGPWDERPRWHLPELEVFGEAAGTRERLLALMKAAVAAQRYERDYPLQHALLGGIYISPSSRYLASMKQLRDAIRSYSDDSPAVRAAMAKFGIRLRRSASALQDRGELEPLFVAQTPVLSPTTRIVMARVETRSERRARFFPHYSKWQAAKDSASTIRLTLASPLGFPTQKEIQTLELGKFRSGARTLNLPLPQAIALHDSLVSRVLTKLQAAVSLLDAKLPQGTPILTSTGAYLPVGSQQSASWSGALTAGLKTLNLIGTAWESYWAKRKQQAERFDRPNPDTPIRTTYRPTSIHRLLDTVIVQALGADSPRRWRPLSPNDVPADALHFPELDDLRHATSVMEQFDLLCFLSAACPYYYADEKPLVGLDGTIVATKKMLHGAMAGLIREFPIIAERVREFPEVALGHQRTTDADIRAGRELLARLPSVSPPGLELPNAPPVLPATEDPEQNEDDHGPITFETSVPVSIPSPTTAAPEPATSPLQEVTPLSVSEQETLAQLILERLPRTVQALRLPTDYTPTIVTVPALDLLPTGSPPNEADERKSFDQKSRAEVIAYYAGYYNTWLHPRREALRAIIALLEPQSEGLLLTCTGYNFRFKGSTPSSSPLPLWELLDQTARIEAKSVALRNAVLYRLRPHAAADEAGPHQQTLCVNPITLLRKLVLEINPSKATMHSTARLHLPSLSGKAGVARGIECDTVLDTYLASLVECTAFYGAEVAKGNPSIVAPSGRNSWDMNHLRWLVVFHALDSSFSHLLPDGAQSLHLREPDDGKSDYLLQRIRACLEQAGSLDTRSPPALPRAPARKSATIQAPTAGLRKELADAPGLLMYALDCFGYRDELRALTALRRKSGYGLRANPQTTEASRPPPADSERSTALTLYTSTLAEALQSRNRVDLSEAGLEAHRSLLKAICLHHYDRNVDAIIQMLTGPLPEFPAHIRPETVAAVAKHMQRLVPPIVQLLEQVQDYQRPPGLRRAPFPYQEIALSEIQLGKRLLALGPGLGKTQVACEEFARLRARSTDPIRRMLFISDAANRVGARAEIADILEIDPARIALVPGAFTTLPADEMQRLLHASEVVVIACQTVRGMQTRAPHLYEPLSRYCAQDGFLVVDEAHRMDHLSLLHYGVRGLQAKERLFLTATLMQSHHRNVGNLLHLVHPGLYPDAAALVGVCESPRAVQALLAQHAVIMFADDVAKPFEPFAQRSAAEQLTDGTPRVPRLTQRVMQVPMPEALSEHYIAILTDYAGWRARHQDQQSQQHGRWRHVHTLKQALYQPERLGIGSADYLVNAAREISEGAARNGEQVLSVWMNTSLIDARFDGPASPKLRRMDGWTGADERYATIRDLKAGKIQEIVGQFGAVSTGHNMQGPAHVVIGQFPTMPLEILQTIARVRRIVTDPALAREEITVSYLVPTLHPKAIERIQDASIRERVQRVGTLAQADYEHAMFELQRFEYLARKRGGSRHDARQHLKRYLDTFAEAHQSAADRIAKSGTAVDATVAALPLPARVDYGNPRKEAWGEREVRFVSEALGPASAPHRRLLLLSGPHDHQLRRFERRGYSLQQMHAVEGGRIDERAQFRTTMQALQVPHTVGRLEMCVHSLPGPFDHASLDWDGYLQPHDVSSVVHLPLAPQATLTLNMLCGREQDSAKDLLHSSGVVGSLMLQRKALVHILIQLAGTGVAQPNGQAGLEMVREYARAQRLAAIFSQAKASAYGLRPKNLERFLLAAHFGSRTVERAEQFRYRSLTSGQAFLTTLVALRAWEPKLRDHPASQWARAVMAELVSTNPVAEVRPEVAPDALYSAMSEARLHAVS